MLSASLAQDFDRVIVQICVKSWIMSSPQDLLDLVPTSDDGEDRQERIGLIVRLHAHKSKGEALPPPTTVDRPTSPRSPSPRSLSHMEVELDIVELGMTAPPRPLADMQPPPPPRSLSTVPPPPRSLAKAPPPTPPQSVQPPPTPPQSVQYIQIPPMPKRPPPGSPQALAEEQARFPLWPLQPRTPKPPPPRLPHQEHKAPQVAPEVPKQQMAWNLFDRVVQQSSASHDAKECATRWQAEYERNQFRSHHGWMFDYRQAEYERNQFRSKAWRKDPGPGQ